MKTTRKLVWTLAVTGIAALGLAPAVCIKRRPCRPVRRRSRSFLIIISGTDSNMSAGMATGIITGAPAMSGSSVIRSRVQRVNVWVQAHPDWPPRPRRRRSPGRTPSAIPVRSTRRPVGTASTATIERGLKPDAPAANGAQPEGLARCKDQHVQGTGEWWGNKSRPHPLGLAV